MGSAHAIEEFDIDIDIDIGIGWCKLKLLVSARRFDVKEDEFIRFWDGDRGRPSQEANMG